MSWKQLREEAQADAIRAMLPVAKKRLAAMEQVKQLTEELRPLVEDALRAGVTTRRIRELTGLGPDTITRWTPRDRA
jgi:transposase